MDGTIACSVSSDDCTVRPWPNVSLLMSSILVSGDRVESEIGGRPPGDRDLTPFPKFGFIDSLSLDEGIDCNGARSRMIRRESLCLD